MMKNFARIVEFVTFVGSTLILVFNSTNAGNFMQFYDDKFVGRCGGWFLLDQNEIIAGY